MTILECIRKGTIELKVANVESPKLKARLLMQYVLNKTRQFIIVNDLVELNEKQEDNYFNYISSLKKGIPIEHITHQKEFMKLNFYVDEDVLIPRQDTEILVEEVINLAKHMDNINILDLCTGSGAIAISIAKYIQKCEVTAIDISSKALKIAKKNAITNNVEDKITFIKSDLYSNLSNNKFDLIVSNPPYIKTSVINQLEEQVKKEPYIALDGGKDGLTFYRRIITEAYQYLKYNGYLCLEIGFNQRKDVENLIQNEQKYTNVISKKDLYNNDRIVIAKLK